ncbi:MAG TPA: TetR/AcrR family transcriptional regulator [Acidimicrobiales bacterium]|nr:TetR/AcrR family transcriptional regulator [Acidimicrobiales bacterium]
MQVAPVVDVATPAGAHGRGGMGPAPGRAGASGSQSGSLGRRERKKDAVRHALRSAALRLASERGLHAVTVEAITEAADVSKRTFFNYFSCKEDALIGPGRELVGRIAEELGARPPGEAPLDALRAVLTQLLAEVEDSPEQRADWAARIQLVQAFPAELLPEQLAVFADLEQAVATGIGQRGGHDPDADLVAALVGAVAVAAIRVAFTQWCRGDTTARLVDLLERALDIVGHGLVPPPSFSPPRAGRRVASGRTTPSHRR